MNCHNNDVILLCNQNRIELLNLHMETFIINTKLHMSASQFCMLDKLELNTCKTIYTYTYRIYKLTFGTKCLLLQGKFLPVSAKE